MIYCLLIVSIINIYLWIFDNDKYNWYLWIDENDDNGNGEHG